MNKASQNRTNQDWLESLEEDHKDFNTALEDLRKYLLTGLEHTFRHHRSLNRDNLEDLCQEALMRILKSRESFSGKSRFTSWAMKIGVNLVLSEIRRKSWNDLSLDSFEKEEPFLDSGKGFSLYMTPEKTVLRKEMAEMCNTLIENCLSDRQKTAIIYKMKYAMPLDEIARRTGSNRNAVYKLLHDARLKLKMGMEAQGIGGQDIRELKN